MLDFILKKSIHSVIPAPIEKAFRLPMLAVVTAKFTEASKLKWRRKHVIAPRSSDQKVPPPWLTPGQMSTGGRREDRNCKEPCLLFLCPTYGVSSDSNKGTIDEECCLWTRVFHAKGVTLVEVGLT
ncbi:hypothetical protein AVEN_231949-1 [Araneus ventricosus]|uniref:Uncharacterized protein n=1 Tax=Araneus ventricosus TaxID=182803 RepID=A0A4Y2C390_ARAVE|nr:hypothetical protein AVEN_231949-1 [Araneus ventricosus]